MNLWEDTLYIDGKFLPISPNQCIPIFNASFDVIIGSVGSAGHKEINQAIVAAKNAFHQTHWVCDWQYRQQCHHQLRACLQKNQGEFLTTLQAQLGNANYTKLPVKNSALSFILPTLESIAAKPFLNNSSVLAVAINDNEPLQSLLNAVFLAIEKGYSIVAAVSSRFPLNAMLLSRYISMTAIPAGIINIITVNKIELAKEAFLNSPLIHLVELEKSSQKISQEVKSA